MKTRSLLHYTPSGLTWQVSAGWTSARTPQRRIGNFGRKFIRSQWLGIVGTMMLAATMAPALAGTLSSDFTDDPGGLLLGKAKIEEGFLKLQDLQELVDGTSSLPMHGSYILPQIDAEKVASFTATFKASIHGGTEQAAQGFSFVLANDLDQSTPFREGGATGDGAGFTTGLVISFDTVDNLAGFSANGNDLGDAPGIIVRIGGSRVVAKKFPNLRTGPPNNQTPTFVPVEVKLDADGTLDVSYNGVKVYDNVPIPYIPLAGSFGFGAGTAELTAAIRANHWIDDLNITTTTLAAGSPALLSIAPPPQGARPDTTVEIQIEDLGAAAVSMIFDDGASFTPSKSVAGNVTTISYDPPGLLAPGSTHTVKLNYGAKSLTYGFTVINATIIPASFAATSVDTTTSGFKVRVHQLEIATSANSYQRAADQLDGKLGPNIADLSLANPDGTFDRELINMEQDGAEAGLFNGTEGHFDELIPGIPGSLGDTEDIAMEVVGYLDLKKGVYTFGLVSDDNARFSVGPHPRDVTGARLIDIAIGTATATVLVDQDGIYPFSVIWAEGVGGAHLELWSLDSSGTRVLLNDRATAGHVKVYRQLKAGVQTAPYLSAAKPGPGDVNVSTAPKLQLEITEVNSQITPGSIKLSINGAAVTLTTEAITKSGAVTTIRYNVAQPLEPKAEQKLKLEFTHTGGESVSREYSFITGTASAGGFAGGQWDFDNGNLEASIGRDLRYIDDSLASRYQFGTTTQLGIEGINGKEAKVIHIPYTTGDEGPIFKQIGLRMRHNITPNGGGQEVNQWTLIMDVYWGPVGSGFGSILQTHDFDNPTDGDMFWRASDGSYGKGCCSNYDGISQEPGHNHKRGEWARVVFSANIPEKRLAKYVNGFKHREDVGGDGASIDGRFGLPPEVFLFGDGDDNERSEAFVNSIQIREGALSDDEVAALGGPSADGIPLPYAQWDFDKGNLSATVGHDLRYIDDSLANRYQFGTTTQLGIDGINGKEAKVIHIPYTTGDEGPIFKQIGLRMKHGLGANGGGQEVNQWTLIMDVYWGPVGSGFGSILQTHDFDNPTDGDMFWRASDGSYGKGCCSNYDGISQEPGHHHARGEWARVVFSANIPEKRLAKYVNGFKHREDVGGDGASIDGRFGLPPEVFLFGDGDDNERSEAFVNSIQIREGALSDDEVAALGGPSADGIPTPNPVKGEWNFDDGNLAAFIGQDLRYIDDSLANRYQFGTTTQLSIDGIGGKEAKVIHVPYTTGDEGPIFKLIGLRAKHGIPPNGGGVEANQWTLIMDVFWGPVGSGFGSILQTHDFDNPTDGDMFWRASDGSYGKGCCSNYDGISQEPGHNHKRGEWARVVFSANIPEKRLAKYVNGFKHREDVGGDGASIDGRFGLPPEVFLFGDGDDNERSEAFVNAIQFREGSMTDDEVAALGGASAFGIPGAPAGGARVVPPPKIKLAISHTATDIVITWNGGSRIKLQKKTALTDAQWEDVANTEGQSTATIPLAGGSGFYRAIRP